MASVEMNSLATPPRDAYDASDDTESPQDQSRIEHQLEPTDRGLAAWRLLCIAFIFEALLWGKSQLARVLRVFAGTLFTH